jgi:hypothetical protein
MSNDGDEVWDDNDGDEGTELQWSNEQTNQHETSPRRGGRAQRLKREKNKMYKNERGTWVE